MHYSEVLNKGMQQGAMAERTFLDTKKSPKNEAIEKLPAQLHISPACFGRPLYSFYIPWHSCMLDWPCICQQRFFPKL